MVSSMMALTMSPSFFFKAFTALDREHDAYQTQQGKYRHARRGKRGRARDKEKEEREEPHDQSRFISDEDHRHDKGKTWRGTTAGAEWEAGRGRLGVAA